MGVEILLTHSVMPRTLKVSPKGSITEIGGRLERSEDADAQFIGLMKFNPEGQKILKKTFMIILAPMTTG